MNRTDQIYLGLLNDVQQFGDEVKGRNGVTRSNIFLPKIAFTEFPLVTLRKTAWKLAIREMEWFLSGDSKCPDELLGWWRDQLSPDGHYYGGYGEQLRSFNEVLDQIKELQDALNKHPGSRRLLLTTWNPIDMSMITGWNSNEKTPTTCHTTIAQFFVRHGILHMTSYQRSADMLLGVPHNWVQSWALLVWLAHGAGFGVGTLQWVFGDAHIYQEETHLATLQALLNSGPRESQPLRLQYHGEGGKFLAKDFTVEGEIPEPVTTLRPRIL